ncbi:MAG: hypothetical protein WC881_08640 [Elusimicrobiota bacterium]|jgi:hypothetical protein
MRFQTLSALILIPLSLGLSPRPARADGDGPSRPSTPAEKAFFSKTLGTIERALPAPPAKWNPTEKPSLTPPSTVFEGVEKSGIRFQYKGKWFDQAQKTRQGQKLQGAIMDSAQGRDMEALGNQMESLQAEQQKIMEEMLRASQRQDKAAMAKVRGKLAEFQKRQQQALSGFSAPQEQALKDSPISDACLEIEVTVNHTSIGLAKTAPLAVPGAERAFRLNDGDPGRKDCPYGRAVALLGAWDAGRVGGDYLYFKSNWRGGIPHPAAKNMIISVRASDQRAEAYLRAVKWDELKALIVK